MSLSKSNALIPAMLRTIEDTELKPTQLKKIIEDIRSGRYKRKPQIKDHPLWELENIAEDILKDANACIQGFRVDIERLIETKYRIIIDIHFGLQAKIWCNGLYAYAKGTAFL